MRQYSSYPLAAPHRCPYTSSRFPAVRVFSLSAADMTTTGVASYGPCGLHRSGPLLPAWMDGMINGELRGGFSCRLVALPPKFCSSRSRAMPSDSKRRWGRSGLRIPSLWVGVANDLKAFVQRTGQSVIGLEFRRLVQSTLVRIVRHFTGADCVLYPEAQQRWQSRPLRPRVGRVDTRSGRKTGICLGKRQLGVRILPVTAD